MTRSWPCIGLILALLFGVMGTGAEAGRILWDAAAPAARLFEAKADAVFGRLAPAP